ncbi:MAG TPA: proline--tRNA ligase [Elusimicrobiota bacterium]|jgi:prolyl-tRNA synthetase|nr:proline--tRNA ligase [Elusimicrobiota bacterium]
MKLGKYLLPTLREAPSDADNVSAKLMVRAGMIRKLAAGIFDWLPLGLRVLRKVERIVRQEMDGIGGQEVWLPVIQPKELWEETGRWGVYGKELLRLEDRKKAQFCFAPTAEEVVTDLVRKEVRSWRQLPLMLYQFGLKFRDEIRPRFGVMRAREFLMKDAYSFHTDDEDATRYYDEVYKAYSRIFERCGLKFKPVEAQSGAIGGAFSHEFMVLAETGEETVVSCTKCAYAANLERAECKAEPPVSNGAPQKLEDLPTPGLYTVADVAKLLGASPKAFLKTQLYVVEGKPVMALVRGDHELNEAKLAKAVGGGAMHRASEAEYQAIVGAKVGFAGPVNLPRFKTPEGKMEEVRIVADHSLQGVTGAVSGANKDDLHLKGIAVGRDFVPESFADLRAAVPEDPCPRCGAKTEFVKGIEVGHVFKLGTKYSKALEATYLDKEQKPQAMVMGCYGIGVSRVVAAAIEQNHDEWGIRWPAAIAPFQVALVPVEHDDPAVKAEADKLYDAFWKAGIECLMDDRAERPGVRFKDIDLIGIPYRIVVSAKTLAAGEVEFKRRESKDFERWKTADALGALKKTLGI